MKNKKILMVIFILITVLAIGTIKVEAASAKISASKTTAEVGDDVTITAKFIAAAWNVKVSGNGISGEAYASQTSDLSEGENIKTFKLDTSKAGTYKISISGDITDANGETKEINQSCTVTVNEKKVVTPAPEPEPELKPEPEPEPEPEKPKTLEFTTVNETVYATGIVNVRESYSASAGRLGQLGVGDSVTRTGISKTAGEDGNRWSKVIYNGKTAYVISSKLSTTKPVEEQPVEEPTEEPTEETPTTADEIKEGLESLEVAGFTLTPAFSPEIYEYRIIIKEEISKVTVNAVAALEGATVTVAGNDDLQEGENLITIMVYNDKNEVEATYQITANKNTLDLTESDKILQMGTREATRNAIIFIAIFTTTIVALIVVLILRSRNKNKYHGEETELEQKIEKQEEQSTENEKNVENTTEEATKSENINTKSEKKKGKHF